MKQQDTRVEKCCEDLHGHALCKHLIGARCNIKQIGGGNWIQVTRGGVDLMREIGCPYFLAIPPPPPEPKSICDECAYVEICEFANDVLGRGCDRYKPSAGVLSQRNWT